MTRLSEALKRGGRKRRRRPVATDEAGRRLPDWQFAPVETMHVPGRTCTRRGGAVRAAPARRCRDAAWQPAAAARAGGRREPPIGRRGSVPIRARAIRRAIATSWSSAKGVDACAGRAVPPSRRGAAPRAEGLRRPQRHGDERAAVRRQDADGHQPGADAERVLSAARAADRRRPAPAAPAARCLRCRRAEGLTDSLARRAAAGCRCTRSRRRCGC